MEWPGFLGPSASIICLIRMPVWGLVNGHWVTVFQKPSFLCAESDLSAVEFLAVGSGDLKMSNYFLEILSGREARGAGSLEVSTGSWLWFYISSNMPATKQINLSTNTYSYIYTYVYIYGYTHMLSYSCIANKWNKEETDSPDSKFHVLSYCAF